MIKTVLAICKIALALIKMSISVINGHSREMSLYLATCASFVCININKDKDNETVTRRLHIFRPYQRFGHVGGT